MLRLSVVLFVLATLNTFIPPGKIINYARISDAGSCAVLTVGTTYWDYGRQSGSVENERTVLIVDGIVEELLHPPRDAEVLIGHVGKVTEHTVVVQTSNVIKDANTESHMLATKELSFDEFRATAPAKRMIRKVVRATTGAVSASERSD